MLLELYSSLVSQSSLSTLSLWSKQGFKLHPKISLGLNKTVIKKTTTRRRKLKAVTRTIVKMEKKPMARNKALVARGRGRGRGGRSGNGKVLPVTTGGRRGRPCKS
ncbi:unnamed protein product [Brassica rapa]|uniref:Uncharacterized protein n=1 Tax=Brassica campestris TaxID=3711 RepID=A0A8D9G876_BRACM|nr:unnamed protein product [Brassica rapa]